MNNKIKPKFNFNIQIIKKKTISPHNNLESINFKNQIPLFKIFMDNNKRKKILLMRNTINNSKEESTRKLLKSRNIKNSMNNKYIFLNPQYISYKILEAKYNISPKLFSQKIIFNLVRNKKCHLLASFHDKILYDNSLKEFLKREYQYNESKDKIPKYFAFYKNYLNFFCRPIFADLFISKKLAKYMEKIAQLFYNNNYLGNGNNQNNDNTKKGKKELNLLIFNNRVIEDIEKCDKFTVVSSEDANKEIQMLTNKIKNTFGQNLGFETEITPISTSGDGKNYQQMIKNNEYLAGMESIKNDNNKKNIIINPDDIMKNNLISIEKIIETNNSLKTLINELKENKNKKNKYIDNKHLIIDEVGNDEKIDEYIANSEISTKIQNIKEASTPKDADIKITKKIPTFKYLGDKIFLSNKYSDKKRTSIGHNQYNNLIKEKINDDNAKNKNNDKEKEKEKGKPSLMNKKMINNLNININQMIFNNKIKTSIHDNARNKEYNKLYLKKEEKNNNNNKIINEIKVLLKNDKNKNPNLESIEKKSNSKNKFKKKIEIKTSMQIKSSYKGKISPKLNRINSMTKISNLSINSNKNMDRNFSTLRGRKHRVFGSLLKLGGGILENNGKLTIQQNSSKNNKNEKNTIEDNHNPNLFKYFNVTKISVIDNKKRKIGTINNESPINNNIFSNYHATGDKNRDKKRNISSIKKRPKKFFSSSFLFNFTNEKININKNSPINSPNSPNISLQKKEDKLNYDLKFNLYLKDMNSINSKDMPLISKKNISKKLLGKRKFNEEQKLKLKNFGCIGIDSNNKNINLFTPNRNSFRKGLVSLKPNIK